MKAEKAKTKNGWLIIFGGLGKIIEKIIEARYNNKIKKGKK